MGKKIDSDWLLQKTDAIVDLMKNKKYAGISTDQIPMFMNKMIEKIVEENLKKPVQKNDKWSVKTPEGMLDGAPAINTAELVSPGSISAEGKE